MHIGNLPLKIRRMTTCGYVQTAVKISHNTENRNLYIARIAGQKWNELVGNSDRLNYSEIPKDRTGGDDRE